MNQLKLVQKNKVYKNKRYSKSSIAILLAGIAMLFFSCENNKIEKIKELSSSDKMPEMIADSFTMIYSDSSIIRFKMITPKMIRYGEEEEEPFTEFPEGVEIEKFDADMKIVSRITSNYARYFEKKKKWIAKNNVVAVNQQGDSLKTEELTWEQDKEKIYSDQFVTIIRQDQIINGIGFESNQNLSDWEIMEVTGTLYMDVGE